VTHDVHRRPGAVPKFDLGSPALPVGAKRKVAA
jgi:NTE family protein